MPAVLLVRSRMPKGKNIRLFHVDKRLERSEVKEALDLVWAEIQLVEYDLVYEGFRGVHLSENETELYITFQIASGGLDNAAMAVMDRETKLIDFAAPPKELLQIEIENLELLLGEAGSDLQAEELSARLREVEDLFY